jgi:hypothetical protein
MNRGLLVLALLLPVALGGCGFFGGVYSDVAGQPVAAQYTGMKKKSVLILVYTDSSTGFIYPQARKEVSSFVAYELRKHLPTLSNCVDQPRRTPLSQSCLQTEHWITAAAEASNHITATDPRSDLKLPRFSRHTLRAIRNETTGFVPQ